MEADDESYKSEEESEDIRGPKTEEETVTRRKLRSMVFRKRNSEPYPRNHIREGSGDDGKAKDPQGDKTPTIPDDKNVAMLQERTEVGSKKAIGIRPSRSPRYPQLSNGRQVIGRRRWPDIQKCQTVDDDRAEEPPPLFES